MHVSFFLSLSPSHSLSTSRSQTSHLPHPLFLPKRRPFFLPRIRPLPPNNIPLPQHRKLEQLITIAITYLTALTTYFSYGLLSVFGQIRDFFRKFIGWRSASNLQGYTPICLGLEDFYIRHLYHRIQE